MSTTVSLQSNLNKTENDFQGQLERFFSSWSKLPPQEIEQIEQPIIFSPEKLDDLNNFLTTLLPPAMLALKKWRSLGSEINVWEVAGLKSDEVRNSKVLNWLLDSYGSHGQGNAILLKLLSFLESRFPDFPKFNGGIGHYSSQVECCPLGDRESRVDIEINGQDFLLFIEVKINATETKYQLDRYLESAEAKAGKNKKWCVLYLTLDGKLVQTNNVDAARVRLSKHLFPLSWTDIVEVLKEYLEELQSVDFSRNSFTYRTIKQFISHIEKFNRIRRKL